MLTLLGLLALLGVGAATGPGEDKPRFPWRVIALATVGAALVAFALMPEAGPPPTT